MMKRYLIEYVIKRRGRRRFRGPFSSVETGRLVPLGWTLEMAILRVLSWLSGSIVEVPGGDLWPICVRSGQPACASETPLSRAGYGQVYCNGLPTSVILDRLRICSIRRTCQCWNLGRFWRTYSLNRELGNVACFQGHIRGASDSSFPVPSWLCELKTI